MNVELWVFAKATVLIALIAAAVMLELKDKTTDGLWTLIVLWIIFGSWN